MAIRIMLDAGHYAKYNHSPVLASYWESEIMWALHLDLKRELESFGFEVFTTRDREETDLAVYERGRKAKGCDLFLSLHSNAANAESVNRVTVYRAFDNRNDADELAGRFAAGIAELMQVSGGYIATRESTEHPGTEYYGVMRGARKENVPLYYIIEHGFHTNLYCARWLSEDTNRKKLARLEAEIIAGFYGVLPKEPIRPGNGDLNGDGKVNAIDYLLVKAAVLGMVRLGEEQKAAADVNGDGSVDAIDYSMIKRAVLGTFTLPGRTATEKKQR